MITTTFTHTIATHTDGHDWITIVLPLIPTIVTAGVAVYAVRVARWQARLQDDKLRLDLFERRLAAWKDLHRQTVDYAQAMTKWANRDFSGSGPSEPVTHGSETFYDLKFLFGDSIIAASQQLYSIALTRSEIRARPGQASDIAKQLSVIAELRDLSKVEAEAQDSLLKIVEERLSLADVGRKPVQRELLTALRTVYPPPNRHK